MKILVTCPPMLGMIEHFSSLFERYGMEVTAADVVQTLSEDELKKLLPEHDGWIIGDDPATYEVLAAGRQGKLKAAVKWGVGVDNVDFDGCRELAIPISNTPGAFGAEVADIAVGYVIALARETFGIDRSIRSGGWSKPSGISLSGKTVALIGYGDIGKHTAKRLLACGMKVIAYDPINSSEEGAPLVDFAEWPSRLEEASFIVSTCSLTKSSMHLVDKCALDRAKHGVRVVNVSRGSVFDESAIIDALKSGRIHSAALDVFEIEPLPCDSYLRSHPRCILGSHNASNTIDAVYKTSEVAINQLADFLGRK